MSEISTKPYLIRAIYEWCADNGFTPYLAVAVDPQTRVPPESVRDGEIVLNIGPAATPNLVLGNDFIRFSARFSGVVRDLLVPVAAVIGIYARENGQGFFFPKEEGAPQGLAAPPGPDEEPPASPPRGKGHLRIIK